MLQGLTRCLGESCAILAAEPVLTVGYNGGADQGARFGQAILHMHSTDLGVQWRCIPGLAVRAGYIGGARHAAPAEHAPAALLGREPGAEQVTGSTPFP
eukprot:2275993-Rhodomonas_salina.3